MSNNALLFSDIDECLLDGTSLASSQWYRSSLTDTELVTCDLANAEFKESNWQRVVAERSRFTGLQVPGCTLQHTRFTDCVADLSNFRFAVLKRVVFERCSLVGTDWTQAKLEEVVFANCDLTGAQFSQASTAKVHFQRCTLEGLKGVSSLSGSVIDPLNLMDLSYQFAAALGITIQTDA